METKRNNMKIAIQGHPTRGKEVIQILESLGGINKNELEGTYDTFYSIDDKNEIYDDHKKNFPPTYTFYTLEGFEEQFPFKVGDKVTKIHQDINSVYTIVGLGLIHDGTVETIRYKLKGSNTYYSKYGLKLYKEMKEKRNITLTIDKAKEWYNKGGELKEVALQAYSEEELSKVDLPKSWEEFCAIYPIQDGEAIIDEATSQIRTYKGTVARGLLSDKNVCPSKQSAEAHLALMQLEQLRDCWRQGWEPDYDDAKQTKYHINYYGGKLEVAPVFNGRYFLTFPTKKMAVEFLKCFRYLIEKAGDLI